MYDIIVKNGTVVDGTGKEMFRADIGIKENSIKDIGDLSNESATEIIDATDRYVAPGFIDIDNHSDTYWRIFADPQLESLVYQGVTTVIGGNCGSSLAPLADQTLLQSIQKWTDIRKVNLNWLSMDEFLSEVKRHHLSVNFATLTGQSTLRRSFVKDDARMLSKGELESLAAMLKKSIKEGSFGCSVGLEYTHARNASGDELQSLGNIIRKNKSVYVFHLRDDSDRLLESIEEVISIARETKSRIHISHLKASRSVSWSLMDQALNIIGEAQSQGVDVTFDIYPYTTTGSVLYTLFPEWVTDGGKKKMIERLKDSGIRHEVIAELREDHLDYDNMSLLISPLNTIMTNQSIAEIAKNQEKTPEEVLIDVFVASSGRAIISSEVVTEENIEKSIQSPFSIISTNGAGYSLEHKETEERVHPRSFGTFPLFFSKYVRDKNLLTWEEAIHKVSGKPAEKFGLQKRGTLRKGNYADIVVFRPLQIASSATLSDPYQYAQGIDHVLVNGEAVIRDGVYTGKRPGEVLRKQSSWF